MENLELVLESEKDTNKLIIVDGVFSMEGDIAKLPEIAALAKKYDAALTKVGVDRGVPVIDHHLSVRNLHQRDLFIDVVHPNARGSERMAEDLGGELVARKLVPDFSEGEE